MTIKIYNKVSFSSKSVNFLTKEMSEANDFRSKSK